MALSAETNEKIRDDAANGIDEGKDNTNFLFLPAAHFKMVVNGRHFKHALAVGKLEIADLNNVAHSFANVNYADGEKQKRAFRAKAERSHHTA